MDGHEVRVERTIRAGPERVWRVLTEPDLVSRWMLGAEVRSTWTPGAPITWAGEYEGRGYEDRGEVLEVDPGRRLSYTHRSSDAEGVERPERRLAWTLDEAEGGAGATRLTLATTTGSPEETDQAEAGWAAILDLVRDLAEEA